MNMFAVRRVYRVLELSLQKYREMSPDEDGNSFYSQLVNKHGAGYQHVGVQQSSGEEYFI